MSDAVRDGAGKRWWLWWPALAVCAWLALFGDGSTPATPDVAVPIKRPADPPAAPSAPQPGYPPSLAGGRASVAPDDTVLTLVPRTQLIPQTSAGSPGRDLFSLRSWAPTPVAPAAAPPAPPPAAPPIPYTFIGKKWEADAWEVYLAQGEQTFVVREGQVLEGRYRIERIAPPTLTFTYVPLDEAQTLSIGDAR